MPCFSIKWVSSPTHSNLRLSPCLQTFWTDHRTLDLSRILKKLLINMPQTGSFNNQEQGAATDPQHAQKDVKLTPPIPTVAWGLSAVDMGKETNQRVTSYVDNLQPGGFKIHVDTWGDAKFYYGSTNWFYPGDCDYQTGSFSTEEDHPYTKDQQKTTKKVQFSRPYAATPNVVVWLTAYDIKAGTNIRVKTNADNITGNGFDLHVDTWDDTRLYSAKASWIAYPADKKGVASGNYSTSDIGGRTSKDLSNSKQTNFASGAFDDAPTVVTGINRLDFDKSNNTRIKLSADGISKTGFTWHIDSWSDSVFYSGSAAYIAFATPK